jgi:hypothetical protein
MLPGMSVDIPQGAMYAFVRFALPEEEGVNVYRMPQAERHQHESARDSDYCLALLEETGICVVPGSGFGQRAGTFHFRTTFLPPTIRFRKPVERLKNFHLTMSKWKTGKSPSPSTASRQVTGAPSLKSCENGIDIPHFAGTETLCPQC